MNNNLSQSVNYWNSALLPYAGWGNSERHRNPGLRAVRRPDGAHNRRFANNFSVNFDYTWSHIMDTDDNDSDQINNPFCIKCNYANAGYDQPNEVSLDFIYQLPKVKGALATPALRKSSTGGSSRGIIRSQSGMPVNLTSNGNLFGDNLGSQYPNLVGNPYAGASTSSWLNQAAFARPADGTWGSLGRDAIRLPHITNVDAGLMKDFAITEKAKLTFRFEIYNLFNHPEPWGMNTGFSGDNPGSGLSASDGNFGYMNAFRDARTLQLALRFAF